MWASEAHIRSLVARGGFWWETEAALKNNNLKRKQQRGCLWAT